MQNDEKDVTKNEGTEIKEGKSNNSIAGNKDITNDEYPKLNEDAKQFKRQPEYIDRNGETKDKS